MDFKRHVFGLLVGLGGVVLSCSQAPESAPSSAEEPRLEVVTPKSTAAPPSHQEAPVATIQRDNGNTVEFFVYPSGVLVGELGSSSLDNPTEPMDRRIVTPLIKAGRFTDLALFLRPDLPVPDALVTLEQNWSSIGKGAGSRPHVAERTSAPTPRHRSGGQPAPPVQGSGPGHDSCNNLCCNLTWLQNTLGCNSDTYFDYDIGYAYEYACGVNFFAGQVCPITNTSVSTIFVDDDPTFHQRDVTVGQYYSYDWSGGGIDSGDCEVWTVNNDQNSDAVSFCIQVDQV